MCGCGATPTVGAAAAAVSSNKPDEILPGENIDCFAKRVDSDNKAPEGPPPPGKIANTSLTASLDLFVDETFDLTPNSPMPALSWKISFDGNEGVPSGMGPNFNPAQGSLKGPIKDGFADKNYRVLVTAVAASGATIDSREFNFFPKKSSKDETIKFVFPYSPNGRITCAFGPRKPPAAGASSMHKGIDISQPASTPGNILSAADGTVIRCGPAKGFGNWIMIEHRDAKYTVVATTVYGHMNEIYVKVGQKVSAGQKIALEGNAGIGSAAHLHFEIHKGAWGNPVDPAPYLSGTVPTVSATDSNGTATAFEDKTRTNTGMTTREAAPSADNKCPDRPANQPGDPGQPPLSSEPPTVPVNPSSADVQNIIQQALDEDAALDTEDKKILMFMAKIESRFIPTAKNKSSSATGLFQMLDKTAERYFNIIGKPATLQNRTDPYLATKAQIAFYKQEQRRYWDEFNSSGKTRLAGKTLSSEASTRLGSLNKGEFIYGVCHHDGVGSGVANKDLGGVAYWRQKIREG